MLAKFFSQKRLWVIPIYFVLYMIAFRLLETHVPQKLHILHTALDDRIPFCEYFVIPYLLWFGYVAAAVFYFALVQKDVREYWQFFLAMGIGLALFLLISWVYPNGQNLRPTLPAEGNIFVEMVRFLYRVDTSTNVLPSMHVFTSMAVATALDRSRSLKGRRAFRKASWILAILIMLSTLFIKQHSAVDAFSGVLLYAVIYCLLYGKEAFGRQPVRVERSY